MTKTEAKQLLTKVADQNKGTDFGKGAELGLWVLELIEEPEQTDPIKWDIKAPEVKKIDKPKEKRVYNLKEKECNVCGKKFKPTNGRQKTCPKCKETAKQLANMAK